MLNEIHRLATALASAGLSVTPQHPRVSTPGRSVPAFHIVLDTTGHVARIYEVTDDEWPGLWTIKEGNHNSFPIVRPTVPLLDVSPDVWIRTIEEVNEKAKSVDAFIKVANRFAIAPLQKYESDLFARLRGKAREIKEAILSAESQDPLLTSVESMVDSFLLASGDMAQFRLELKLQVLRGLGAGKISPGKALQDLLFGKRRKDGKIVTTVQLAFASDDGRATIYSEKVRRDLEGVLPRDASGSRGTHPARKSAYGEDADLQTGPFPKVRLPVINKDTPLVSMFSDAACNQRYGLTDSAIVPVSKVAASRMQDALAHIVAVERKGRTWCGVPSGRFEQAASGRKREQQELLIAYVDGQPELHVSTVALFGAGETLTIKQFEVDASVVCNALEGIAEKEPGSRLQLFVIRQASEGQSQVALAESPRVSEVLAGARWWQEAAANLPDIPFYLPAFGKQRAGQATPPVPYPSQVVSHLSWKWGSNGERSTTVSGPSLSEVRKAGNRGPHVLHSTAVSGPSLGEVLAVMLRVPGRWKDAAERLLDMAIERTSPLLLAAGGRRWSLKERDLRTALIGVSVLGVLLAASERRKEEYMSSPAFLVGRMMALADSLHRAYCKEVRSGQMPPQLLGNALMSTARTNLQAALDRLGERIHVYQAWAATADIERDSQARRVLGQLGRTSRKLSQTDIPAEMSQLDRAELLLGYLAGSSEGNGDRASNTEEEDDD